MPQYEFPFTIPANTLKATPAEQEISLAPGTITHVGIQFAPGCHGLVFVQVYRALHQVWPANPGDAFSGNDVVIAFTESYRFTGRPWTLILKGWSPGTEWPHTITFRFTLQPRGLLGL